MYTNFIEDFLTIEECNGIIEIGKTVGLEKMTSAKFVNGVYTEVSLNEETNKRKGCYFTGSTLDNNLVKTISDKTIRLLNTFKVFNGVEYTRVPKYSFNEYNVGDFLTWHSDSHEIMYGASLTVIYQLNSEYKGGEVKYIVEGLEYSVPKKTGSLFIFDSNILHSVEEVTEGIRYSLNVWPSSKFKRSVI